MLIVKDPKKLTVIFYKVV